MATNPRAVIRREIHERAARLGTNALGTAELLALVLDPARDGEDSLLRATRLLALAGGLAGLIEALRNGRETSLRPRERTRLLAALSLAGRQRATPVETRPRVGNPQQAEAIFRALIGARDREVFAVLTLNSKNRVIAREILYVGTVNRVNLRVAEIYAAAIRLHGTAILVAHNHPSGEAEPSPEDFACTGHLAAAGTQLDIAFHDHLILAGERTISLRRDYPASAAWGNGQGEWAAERRQAAYVAGS